MLQNIPREKIIELVRQGPTFPAKIAKQLASGGDTMLIGAILSTLISTGEVKVSTLKVGGSPLYYAPEQESKLEDFISYMNEKDRRTFNLLKEQKVLQDSAQDPLTRVSLRTIKDFAKQFELDHQGKKVLFWRFYSMPLAEALSLAKKVVVVKLVEAEKPIEKAVVEEIVRKPERKPSLILEPKPIEKPVVVEHHVEHRAEVVQQVLQEPVPVDVSSEKVHDLEKVHDKHEHHEKTEKTEKVESEKHLKPKTHVPKTPRQSKIKEPKKLKAPKIEYNFFELLLNHISSKNLDVISKEKIKKTEYDLVLKNHNNNEYIYCKAKDKSSISEGDLAPALIFAQNKKMPCLFLSTGELNKKAESMINKEFSGLKFERIIVEVKSTQ